MASTEARRHELAAAEMHCMRSERTAQQEGTNVTNTYQRSLCSTSLACAADNASPE